MAEIRDSWLASGEESAIEPELRVCDPHHHLWDTPRSRYLAAEFARDARSHGVEKSVFIECGSAYRSDGPEHLRPVGETEFVERIAREVAAGPGSLELNAGIVGHANLLLGEAVDEVLEAHLAASPERFRGIRHSAAWHESDEIRESHSKPPPHMLTLPKFREGFSRLRRYDLSFDAWLFHSQLDELLALARVFPDTPIVLDHLGGPLGIGPYANQREQVFDAWRRSISSLAACQNVVVKLGGIQMAISGFGWHKRTKPPTSLELTKRVEPYYLHCIEAFGPERCMFESNFPVDKVSCSYTVLWNAFKSMSGGCSPAEREAMLWGTAKRVYRI